MRNQSGCYRARWIFPVDTPPIENGVIDIEDGRIVGLTDRPGRKIVDLGNAALIPGLINAHTHLEFSDLNEPVAPAVPFTSWIRHVVRRRQQVSSPSSSAIRRGLSESERSGCSGVGEIATEGWERRLCDESSLNLVLFQELRGFTAARIEPQLTLARAHLEQVETWNDRRRDDRSEREVSNRIVAGLSPHAPYSVHPELFRRLVQMSIEFRAPLAVHLAETESELELLDRGTGEFRQLLVDFGVWDESVLSPGRRPLDYLKQMTPLSRGLVVHGNYLSPDEIAFLAGHLQLTVVYCPRTHAFFQHAEHPWLELLRQGASVALGTDSRASNPDLSLWNELLFLREQFPAVDPALLLELGTLRGARAMGWEKELGSLAAGKRADCALVAIPDSGRTSGDPWPLLFDPQSCVTAVMHAGCWANAPVDG